MRILAMDNALNHSGWVVLEDSGKGIEFVIAKQYGVIMPKQTMSLGFKLHYNRSEMISLFKKYKPDVIVLEETYSGNNLKTAARLNCAKGAFLLTAYELLGEDPACVTAATARKCLGFKNNKSEAFEFFQNKYELFRPEGNTKKVRYADDITDAFVVGFWYILDQRGECKEIPTTKKTKKENKK